MRKIVVLFMLAVLILPACKKEKSATGADPEDRAQVSFEIDGEQMEIGYGNDKVNKCSVYSFGGYSGNYFGINSLFELNERVNLEITFGTLKTSNTILSDEEFVTLIAPGKREYGALGSFTSNPQLTPGKVEIAFTDKKSVRWCTSVIKEMDTPYGIETEVEVKQEHSEFKVDEIEKLESGYRIKGTFNCFIYEVNGKHKKKMKGAFVGIITRD